MASENMNEECGIAAVYQLDHGFAPPLNVTQYLPGLLLDLQNRGQLAAGITSYDANRNRLLQTYKGLGSVGQVFKMHQTKKAKALIDKYRGTVAIGHVRYATSGQEDRNFAQPFERVHGKKWKWFSIAFNGNLANYSDLKQELVDAGYHITYNTDTELMMHFINKELIGDEQPPFKQLFAKLSQKFDGAFNIAFVNGSGDLVVMRGPMGIKPLCYGIKNGLLFVASESVALTRLGIMDYRDLEPGCILVAHRNGYSVQRYAPKQRTAHCFFEWVYFANLASTLDQRSVYKVRRELGVQLAQMEDLEIRPDDIVVPVPETSKVAADGFSYELRIPSMEGLVRNRYVGRTFIEGETRQSAIMRKFTPLPEILEDRRIFLVDDSLVRAVTLKTIISDLRLRGKVGEVHVRIAAPPIIAPCFYGIDIPTVKELFATKFWKPGMPLDLSLETQAEMARLIGADSLKFLTTERLFTAVGFDKNQLCSACVTAKYPTVHGQANYQMQLPEAYGEAFAENPEPEPIARSA